MSQQDIEQRVVQLEIKLTYQQKLIEELNAVVTDQTLRLMQMEKKLHKLTEQQLLVQAQMLEQLPNLPNEKPPHY